MTIFFSHFFNNVTQIGVLCKIVWLKIRMKEKIERKRLTTMASAGTTATHHDSRAIAPSTISLSSLNAAKQLHTSKMDPSLIQQTRKNCNHTNYFSSPPILLPIPFPTHTKTKS